MKTDTITIRIDTETKAKLKAAAEAENRTISNYVEILIKNTLHNQAFLKLKWEFVEWYVECCGELSDVHQASASYLSSYANDSLHNWLENHHPEAKLTKDEFNEFCDSAVAEWLNT